MIILLGLLIAFLSIIVGHLSGIFIAKPLAIVYVVFVKRI